jgi:hypothetical protein
VNVLSHVLVLAHPIHVVEVLGRSASARVGRHAVVGTQEEAIDESTLRRRDHECTRTEEDVDTVDGTLEHTPVCEQTLALALREPALLRRNSISEPRILLREGEEIG